MIAASTVDLTYYKLQNTVKNTNSSWRELSDNSKAVRELVWKMILHCWSLDKCRDFMVLNRQLPHSALYTDLLICCCYLCFLPLTCFYNIPVVIYRHFSLSVSPSKLHLHKFCRCYSQTSNQRQYCLRYSVQSVVNLKKKWHSPVLFLAVSYGMYIA